VIARVHDDQRLGRDHAVLAERVRERRFASLGELARQTHRALEELAMVVDQGHQSDRYAEQLRGQTRQAIERGLGRGVHQLGVRQRR